MSDSELKILEGELQQLLLIEPPTRLRAGVLRSVSDSLRRRPTIDWLSYAAFAATALVLWANLSWTVTRSTAFVEPAVLPSAAAVAQIRELLPGLSEAEARHQAVVLTSGARRPDGNSVRRVAALGIGY
jgi:hypothetical protein